MCGINGLVRYGKSGNFSMKDHIQNMNKAIIHRGPDDKGIFVYRDKDYEVGMGMRRLSIIDLTSGKQPIKSEDGKITIVFNGEIYNYLFLKKELQSKGATFNTRSDTEVILRLYEQEGEDSFAKLDGMFAFSIYDQERKKLFIARDFFGEKPLYYMQQPGSFLWASELKSMIPSLKNSPEISKQGLNLFFRLTYIPSPYTIYEGIYKLEPDHYLEYDMPGQTFEIHRISKQVNEQQDFKEIDLKAAASKVHEMVMSSVESRSISDVPLGTFLSGGVDSSIVSLCLSKTISEPINTFSIGFKKDTFDETDKSRLVAKLINSRHHEFKIEEKDLKDNIHEIILNFDEPFADSSALPTYLVSKKTRDHVKVALTGDGGDEVFGGYNKYYIGRLNEIYTRKVPDSLHKLILKTSKKLLPPKQDSRGKRFKMLKLLNSINYNGDFYWDMISQANTGPELSNLLVNSKFMPDVFELYKSKLGIPSPISIFDFRMVDKLISLEGDMLPKVDRTSMMNSLECRAPFLNRQIWEFTKNLPQDFLVKGWDKKYILKEAFKEYFPKGFLDKSKQGFLVPVGDWLRSILKAELLTYVDKPFIRKQGIFNYDELNTVVMEHLQSKKDSTYSVWTFYCFQKWYTQIYAPALTKIL